MKELCIVLVLILVTSLAGIGQAETRVDSVWSCQLEDPLTGEVTETHYYAKMSADTSNESAIMRIDEETYEMILHDQEEAQARYDNRWDVKACRWCVNAATDAWDWISFWD